MAKVLDPSTTVPRLIEALSDPVAGVRMSAAFILGYYDSNAKPAISALVSRIADLDEFAEVRCAALVAVESIDPHDPAVLDATTRIADDNDDNDEVRELAKSLF